MAEKQPEIKKLIAEDPDYVNMASVRYNLEELLKKYPEGCPDNIICAALGVHRTELPALLEKALRKLKQEL